MQIKQPRRSTPSPTRCIAGPDGHVAGIEFVKNELGPPDASGRRRYCGNVVDARETCCLPVIEDPATGARRSTEMSG